MSEGAQPERASWPQIGDIAANHDGYCPSSVAALDGTEMLLGGDIGASIRFGSGRGEWIENGAAREFEYQVFPAGPQLFMVDAMPVDSSPRSQTLILDLTGSRALIVDVVYPAPALAQTPVLERLAKTGSQSAVKVTYRQAPLGKNSAPVFARTSALNGKHLRYTYSSTHVYDHYYLSERFYSWFCRAGPDKGLGDFEECDYFELGPQLYLVSWREKLLPCVGILVENHREMHCVGKICGTDAYTGALGNSRVGGTFQLIANSSNA